MRLEAGQEALVARVTTKEGRTGFGFSFRLDAEEARHMAEWHAGLRKEKPRFEAALDHPWERAYLAHQSIPWETEPGFGSLQWLP